MINARISILQGTRIYTMNQQTDRAFGRALATNKQDWSEFNATMTLKSMIKGLPQQSPICCRNMSQILMYMAGTGAHVAACPMAQAGGRDGWTHAHACWYSALSDCHMQLSSARGTNPRQIELVAPKITDAAARLVFQCAVELSAIW